MSLNYSSIAEGGPWWIFVALLALYIANQLSLIHLPQWYLNRERETARFLLEQLGNPETLSTAMNHHLSLKRERLLLKISEGIDTNINLGRELHGISQDHSNGLDWGTIKTALPHLRLDHEGKIEAKVAWWRWLYAVAMLVPAAIMVFLYLRLGLKASETASLQVTALLVALAVVFLLVAFVFLRPSIKIYAVWRVRKHLRSKNRH